MESFEFTECLKSANDARIQIITELANSANLFRNLTLIYADQSIGVDLDWTDKET